MSIRFPVLICLLALCSVCVAQGLEDLPVSADLAGGRLQVVLQELGQVAGVKIFLAEDSPHVIKEHSFSNKSLGTILDTLLRDIGLSHITYRDYLVVVGDERTLAEEKSASFYKTLYESIDASLNTNEREEIVIGNIEQAKSSDKIVVSGFVSDISSGEGICGATLLVSETGLGTDTEEAGKYELSLAPGKYTLVVQYIGYSEKQIPIRVISSGRLDIEMSQGSILLDEVVVEAQRRDENIQAVQAGVTRISIKELEKLPSFLGEVDLIKGILQQPGVSTIGEGSSGFNVRGGDIDQNLILIDEGVIFNASHALGFFSSFNSDILKDAVLHKGNIPAKFGGRLASVLDVNIKDGDFGKLRFRGGLGVVSSRLTLEGPIKENKTSFLISGRSSYSDWILKSIKIPEVSSSSAFFYDANLKLTHRFNERNFLSVSTYSTSDQFTYAGEFGFDYGTILGQAVLRSVLGDRWLSTFSLNASEYKSNQFDLIGSNASKLSVGNKYIKIKENLHYDKEDLEMDFGLSGTNFYVNSGVLTPEGLSSAVIPRSVSEERGRELAAYSDAAFSINPRLSLSAGLRFTTYQFLGPREMYIYENPERPEIDDQSMVTRFDEKVIHQESLLQPRFSARYLLDENSSIRLGYARVSQYISQISNNDTPTPTSLWKLSNQYLPSQLAHNFSLGFFKNYAENIWNTSVELYYRDIDRLVEYEDFADLIANPHLETELVTGEGRAYGIELSLKKQVGFIHGWLNYTYSRSERQVQGINHGAWYASNFDKPHDLSIVTNLQLNKRNLISFNFTFASGRAITIPLDRHVLQNEFYVLNYSDRNEFRAPAYHRLDLAYTVGQGFRKSKKFKTSWTFSVYNLYGRRNAFSIFVIQDSFASPKVQRLSVLGNAFPSLTFNFELL